MNLQKTAATVLAALVSLSASAYETDKTYRFTILHTNDTHGRFWENEHGEGGFAAQKTLIDRIRKEVAEQGGEVLLLSAGDINTGVPESDIQNAEPDIAGMNLMGYEAMVLGNHEFDKPIEVLNTQLKQASFPFISANTVDARTNEHIVKPYAMFNKGGLKIAVVGLTTEDTGLLSAHTQNIQFNPPIYAARQTLRHINHYEKPDFRIALTHMGYYPDDEYSSAAPGDITLARSLDLGAFNLIIGGHTHNTVCMNDDGTLNRNFKPNDPCRPDYQNGTWIVQAGEWGKYLGRADFEFKNGLTRLVNYRLIPINLKQKIKRPDGKSEYVLYSEQIPADRSMISVLKPYQDKGNELLGVKVGVVQGTFDGSRDAIRHKQTNLGNLLTYVQRERLKGDVAIINGGSIRHSLNEGEITYKNLLKMQPFRNTLTSVRLKGSQLSDYLQKAALKERGSGAYPQFSANVSMTVNYKTKTVDNILLNDKPINPDESYTLVLPNFMAEGGDGYPNVSKERSYSDSGFVDAQVLRDYFAEKGTVNAADFAANDKIVYQK